ncbi:MAG: phosphodiester glycosidase family protein [Oscillospiraceae bacterium]|nr:phosphodiester glycosidase family protein [Oscillospiraceae bacterium]
MRTGILKLAVALTIVLSLLFSVTAYAVVGDIVYTNTRMIANNLEFRNTISWDGTLGRTESFALTMTGQGDARPIIMKGETVFGTTRISSMIELAESRGKNVLAAVNADFFFAQHGGVPMGIVIEDGVYKSSPGGRNAVVFGFNGSVDIIEAPTVWISLFNNGGSVEHDNAGESVSLTHFNKPRTEHGGMVMYSEAFSLVSTRTTTPGWFVRFRILDGRPTVSGAMTLEVTETFVSTDAPEIGEGYLILTAAYLSNLHHEFEKFAAGDIVTMTTSPSDQRLINAQYATGGGYVLVSNGVKNDSEGWSDLLQIRAPRTAIGLRTDGSVIVFVMDGRRADHSVGLTLDELAEEMVRLGAVYAVNLDGGGSSAMSVRIPGERDATVVSRPSDNRERGCATYLLFVTDAIPGGPARNLGIENNGAIVLAGSTIELRPIATDSGYMPAAVPGDIQAMPMFPGSVIDGMLFTAGEVAGPDRIDLHSPSTGATGLGEVFVLTRPTSISARLAGSTTPLTSVQMYPGELLELDIVATYYRRAVTAQAHSFEFTIDGNIGEMVEPGVFQAGFAAAQRGTVSISAGGRSTSFNVELAGFTDMQSHWARNHAHFLAAAGIVRGVTPSEYGPELPMRRGDFILMLHRAAGLPVVYDIASFADVPGDAYFAEALAWARQAGIAGGTVENTFEPLMPLTRASAFTFTYRALDMLGINVESGTADDLAEFPDAGDVADFAVVPTATLIRLGIVEGSNGLLIPDSTLTRAQMAKVLAMVIQLG